MPIEAQSRRVDTLILRFCNSDHADLTLSPGVHAIGRDHDGDPCRVDAATAAIAQICVDRRGVWLQVRDGVRGLHVNGRPVRRMAMLRGGDAVFIDGVELLLRGREPLPAPDAGWPQAEAPPDRRDVVLRGIGGSHHGRCFVIDRRLTIGTRADSDIRIEEASADDIAWLEPHVDGMVLRAVGASDSQVNGWPVRDALLRPGDQLVLDAQHRFAVEASTWPAAEYSRMPPAETAFDDNGLDHHHAGTILASARRLPWLLLAAALLAVGLSLLLMYGVR